MPVLRRTADLIQYLHAPRSFIFSYGQKVPARTTRQEDETRAEVRRQARGAEGRGRLRRPPEAPEKCLAGAAQEPLRYLRQEPRLYARLRPLTHPVPRARARGEDPRG